MRFIMVNKMYIYYINEIVIPFNELPDTIYDFEEHVKSILNNKPNHKINIVVLQLIFNFENKRLYISIKGVDIISLIEREYEEITLLYNYNTGELTFPYNFKDDKKYYQYIENIYNLSLTYASIDIPFDHIKTFCHMYLEFYNPIQRYNDKSLKCIKFINKLIDNEDFIKMHSTIKLIAKGV